MNASTRTTNYAIETILYPTDFSERSAYAFQVAQALARDAGAKLIVLHVLAPMVIYEGMGATNIPYQDSEKAAMLARLRQFQVANPLVEVEHRVELGDPASVILDLAKEKDCKLIVMGTHGRTGLARLLLGSVAEQVVRKAPCPVMTIKSPFRDPGEVGQISANSSASAGAAEQLVGN